MPDTPKARALKSLNLETRTIHAALNQAASAITHAQRALEQNYNRRRSVIINEPDPEPLHAPPDLRLVNWPHQ